MKVSRTEIGATEHLTPSDLKNRPLNRGRAPYVCSKKNTFCQFGVPECPVKTTPKIRLQGNSYNKKTRFWPISRDVKKVTKKCGFCPTCFAKRGYIPNMNTEDVFGLKIASISY